MLICINTCIIWYNSWWNFRVANNIMTISVTNEFCRYAQQENKYDFFIVSHIPPGGSQGAESKDCRKKATMPLSHLTSWSWDKMSTILQTAFSYVFPCLKPHGTGTEVRYQDPSALPWSKMATATTGKDVYSAISTLSHCVFGVWRWV